MSTDHAPREGQDALPDPVQLLMVPAGPWLAGDVALGPASTIAWPPLCISPSGILSGH